MRLDWKMSGRSWMLCWRLLIWPGSQYFSSQTNKICQGRSQRVKYGRGLAWTRSSNSGGDEIIKAGDSEYLDFEFLAWIWKPSPPRQGMVFPLPHHGWRLLSRERKKRENKDCVEIFSANLNNEKQLNHTKPFWSNPFQRRNAYKY